MFFLSQIFLLAILQISEINTLTFNEGLYVEEKTEQRNENTFYFEDVEQNSLRTLSTHSPIFKNNQKYDESTNPNLKFNVFDKMLSDEILSIQQHLYEKDITYSAPVQTTSKNNIRTPTLEIKQKWSFEQFIPKIVTRNNDLKLGNTEININNMTETVDNKHLNTGNFSETENFTESYKIMEKVVEMVDKTSANNKEKVIGLRSLYRDLPQFITTKICTCMKTNPSLTCSHPCTGPERINSHKNYLRSDDTKKEHKKRCTRHQEDCIHDGAGMPSQYSKVTPPPPSVKLTMPLYPPYYPPYQSYFIGMTTVIPVLNAYYYTEAKNTSIISKNKKHSSRKVKIKGHKDKNDDDYEEYPETVSYYTEPRKADHEVLNIELGNDEVVSDETVDRSKIKKIKLKQRIYDEENNKFVNSIVEDLKTHYSEVVIKDCFCSSSTQKIISTLVSLCCCIVIVLIV